MLLGGPDMVLGVELVGLAENQFSFRSVLLLKKNNAVVIAHRKSSTGTLGEVISILPKDYPVALVLAGKGIIHKNQTLAEGFGRDQLFSMAFPSIERKEFYVQEVLGHQNSLLSLLRKSQADDLLTKLEAAGLTVHMLSLGGIITQQIWAQLNVYGTALKFDGHFFSITEAGELLSYQYDQSYKASFPVKIDQEAISEEHIVAYAAAFQLLLQDKLMPILADVESVNDRLINFESDRKLKQKGMFFIFSLFFLLLLSFLVFVHYNQENAGLAAQLGSITANSDQLEVMKENIAENKLLLKELKWNGGYNYGFLVNEIGRTLPKQLKLKAIAMNEFKTEEEKNLSISNLRVTGTTSNLTAVNNWIFVLKEMPWVKSVKLEKYQEEQESDRYEFNLLLTY